MNDQTNGHALSEIPKNPGFVSIEVQPLSLNGKVTSASIGLAEGDGKDDLKIAAVMGPEQLREIAARMLSIADAIDPNMRTILVVTKASSWLPHQVLQIRDTPTQEFHYDFLVKSELAVPEKQKLIIP